MAVVGLGVVVGRGRLDVAVLTPGPMCTTRVLAACWHHRARRTAAKSAAAPKAPDVLPQAGGVSSA